MIFNRLFIYKIARIRYLIVMSFNRENIRNFSIIAHIDHGKSTLSDRMLEITNTIEKRVMKDQVLDRMDLERERGITIKMQPVRMEYKLDGREYVLNLIDTPGHIDFRYEVSRSLFAVEGAILLVDSTQGVQAQTLTTLNAAREAGLVILPVLSKIDSPLARPDDVALEIMELLEVDPDEILRVSGKTGEGVEDLIKKIIATIPAPENAEFTEMRAVIFDYAYSNHTGITIFIRVTDGEIKKGDQLKFCANDKNFIVQSVGIMRPDNIEVDSISTGEIGYIITGIKEAEISVVGDTIISKNSKIPAHIGYANSIPMVFASVYPESQDDIEQLRWALSRMKLMDASLTYDEETSGTLGRGFRCGFLGMLHLEIITERLKREFNIEIIITSPSVTYRVITKDEKEHIVYSPVLFPDYGEIKEIYEPWVSVQIFTPSDYLGAVMQLLHEHEAVVTKTENFGDGRILIVEEMPLRELMRNFFDALKSVSSGYASITYESIGEKPADVVKLDITVADDLVPALSRVVARVRAQVEGRHLTEKLSETLSRQMFTVKIQAHCLGKIIASKTLSALRKNVTAHLYGGDITRKMKLREKQKKGKKKMASLGKVHIPPDVFINLMKPDN